MAPSAPAPTAPSRNLHLYGLDSFRFLSALLVIFTHTGVPFPTEFAARLGTVGKILGALYINLFNGQGAVMVFFVVSGLCIHLPQVGRGTPNWGAFLIRRYLRLAVPLLAAFALSPLLRSKIFGGANPVYSIWWSLIAELIYYTCYPALFWAARRWSWTWVVAVSFGVSLVLLGLNYQVLHPAKFGRLTTAIIYLPVWILGCLLAEQIGQGRLPLPQQVGMSRWLWRAAIVGALILSNALIHHAPQFVPNVRFPFSVLMVGVVAWLWLPRELAWCQAHRPFRWLEWCGALTYSLYLTHLNWHDLWIRGSYRDSLGKGTFGEFVAHTLFILAMTVVFYFLIEGPSHRLARAAGQWWDRRTQSAQPAPG